MTPKQPDESELKDMEKGVVNTEVSGEMKKAYLDYAMSVIVSRAIPAVEDGLKPVQRRILYAMNQMGLKPNTQTKKSARIVGECFVKDTQTLTTKGLIPIQDIRRGDFVYTHSGIQEVTELYEMPKKPLFKITLKNGISITTTPSQKVKILNKDLNYEWKEVKDIKADDFIVIKTVYPDFKENVKLKVFNNKYLELNENIAYLLGQFLSDGWIEKKTNRIGFYSTSEGIINNLAFILKKEFNYIVNIESKNYSYQTTSGSIIQNQAYQIRINHRLLCNFLANTFGLYGKTALTKEIPQQIFTSPKKVIFSFISGLIDGDGSIHKQRNVVHYSSISEKLIDGLLLILQHIGILGRKLINKIQGSHIINGRSISSNYQGYSLEFVGDAARKLSINLVLMEERKKERLLKITQNCIKKSKFETIPYLGKKIFPEFANKHLGGGWFQDKKGEKFRLGIKYPKGCKIRYCKNLKEIPLRKSQIFEWNILEKLKRIDSKYYAFLKDIIENKIYFMGVKEIEQVPPEKTYDMQVKDDHEFMAKGVLSHNCLGKYHPHGDVSVYDAMVRMAQNFSLRYPLVFGQGNFGSIDADPPAAQRYTEAKLMPISMEVLQDIEKETVKFVPNYDNSMKEPELLPGKLPLLMLNGATGIAVGMATNIPPHNLTEVCDSLIAYIKKPNITIEQLSQIVTGPDFPTGGTVFGDMEELYKTGKGKMIMRGRLTTETVRKKEAIVITEIPYMLNKSTLVQQIADLVQNKKIKDVSDLRDESSKGKIRIVIELRKGVDSKFVINSLYKYTRLQDSFNVNFLALVGGQPNILNLKQVVEEYVKYRKLMVTNRVKYELKKAKERQEIVEGLLIALKNIDAIIKFIKQSKNTSEALEGLIKRFKLTRKQAQAVLETKLQQLTSLEQDKLKKEAKELKERIAEYEKILADVKEVLKIIVKEINELKNKYGDNRRTQVMKRLTEISEKDLVQEKEVVVTITEKGYCKRIDVKDYKEQRRGGKGSIGSNLATGDFVKQLITCSTHDYLMFFTTRGRVLWLKAYDIPSAEKYSKGKALINLLSLKDERITNVISVDNFEDCLFMATQKGMVKKISLSTFSKPRASGVKAINLPGDNSDILIGVEVVKKGQEVSLATQKGKAIRFDADSIRAMGRASYGVTGIRMEKPDKVVSLEILDTQAILTITENGYGKRTAVKDYRKTARGGKGVINVKVSTKTGDVVAAISVNNNDSIIFTTAKGIVIRTSLRNIRVMGRAAQGVRIVKLAQGDKVTDLVKVENGDD